MKYGYYIRTVHTYREIRNLALLAEKYGFDSVHVNDHLIGFDPERKDPYLEAMVLMSAIAAETQRVKIGHIVLANSFRNPALTAKIVSSIDNISNGRALLWIGTGWYEEEYKAYGYPFPSAKQRVDELEESLTIFKKLFTEETTNFEGKFWKLVNCKNFPKPVQKPWPQIVIGAVKNRLTEIACREADGVNLPHEGLDSLKKRIGFIASKLHKHNRNPDEFEISTFNVVTIVNNEEELDKFVNQAIERVKQEGNKLTKEEIMKESFIGYVGGVKEQIKQVEEFGVKKMVISVRGGSSIEDPTELFHDKIM
ncbi:MAG: LLM class flavin-dependent oxidoreductase [Candidatus Bathyarchaeota archaeon]|nr:LLM class flavin-dependent oxidoreductase [Candidatus Bathyarchaeota archaeon]MDH5787788.1 LLM class flavin-dependent oxidoreductase [Candidatus Bathyarchaeota archaeon]